MANRANARFLATPPSIAFHAAGRFEATLTAVPYYLWANRGAGSMLVWVPEA